MFLLILVDLNLMSGLDNLVGKFDQGYRQRFQQWQQSLQGPGHGIYNSYRYVRDRIKSFRGWQSYLILVVQMGFSERYRLNYDLTGTGDLNITILGGSSISRFNWSIETPDCLYFLCEMPDCMNSMGRLTSRPVYIRFAEHLHSIRYSVNTLPVGLHCQEPGHTALWTIWSSSPWRN